MLFRHLEDTTDLGTYKNKGEHKSGPFPNKMTTFFQGGVLQLHQPNVQSTVFLKEVPMES